MTNRFKLSKTKVKINLKANHNEVLCAYFYAFVVKDQS